MQNPHLHLSSIIFLLLILLLSSVYTFADEIETKPTRQRNRLIHYNDYVYIASKVGLLRFDANTEEWQIFTRDDGLPDNRLLEIELDQGLLWLGTNEGVGNSDVRFNDWLNYDNERGLPHNHHRAFAFDLDYVWTATDSGVGRYDRYLEEWVAYTKTDGLPAHSINDIFVADEYVWAATDLGVGRYDKKVETWLTYGPEDGLLSSYVYWIREVGEEIWFFTDNGISRFNPKSQTWRSITETDGLISYNVFDIEPDGNTLWLVTDRGIVQCDWRSGTCVPFLQKANLAGAQVRDISMTGNQVWFATDRGLFRYLKSSATAGDGQTGEEWLRITAAKGLQSENLHRVVAEGELIFVFTGTGIDIFRSLTNDVLSFYFEDVSRAGSGRTGDHGLAARIDDTGFIVDAGAGVSSRLSGTYSFTSQTFSSDLLHPQNSRKSFYTRHRAQLYENVTFPNDRTINAYYDNTYLDDILYGAVFRGNMNDNLRQARLGNRIRPDLVNTELIGDTYIEGAMIRLEAGDKTSVKKRRRFRTDAYFGEREAVYEQEIFYGRGDVLYHLKHADIIIGSATVWVDGEQQSVQEYNLDHTNGLLLFTFPGKELISSETKIEVIYQYRPHDKLQNEQLGAAQSVVSFGDDAFVGLSFLRDQTESDSAGTQALNIANAFGEVWLKSNDENRELRIRPELAFSQDDFSSEKGMASRVEILSRISKLQVQGNFQEYDKTFRTIGRRRTEFGEIMGYRELSSRFEPYKWLPVDAGWKRESARNGAENTGWARLSIAHPRYPALTLTATQADAKTPAMNRRRQDYRLGMEYELPDYLASKIAMNRAFLYFQLRRITTDIKNEQTTRDAPGLVKSDNGFLRLKLSPSRKFTFNADVRVRDRVQDLKSGHFTPLDRDSYVLINATTVNLIPGMSAFSRILGRGVQHKFDSAAHSKDVYLENRGDVNAEVLPGVWWSGLDWLVINGSYGSSTKDSLLRVDEDKSIWHTWLYGGEDDGSAFSFSSKTKMIKATMYPANRVIFTETYTNNSNNDLVFTRIFTSKIEWEPTLRSRIVAQHQFTDIQDDRPGAVSRTRHRPFAYWEQQWSNQLHTRLRLIYDRREEGPLMTSDLTPSCYVLIKVRKAKYFGDIDFRNDLAFSRQEQTGMRNELTYRYSNSSRLDWRLTRNFILRFDARMSYLNNLKGGNDKLSLDTYLRLSVRL